jgi:hypothetical protein
MIPITSWRQPDWLPTLRAVSWPRLDRWRGQHVAAVAAVAEDPAKIVELAQVVERAVFELGEYWDEAEVALDTARRAAREARSRRGDPVPGSRVGADFDRLDGLYRRALLGTRFVHEDPRMAGQGGMMGATALGAADSLASRDVVSEPVIEARAAAKRARRETVAA